MPDTCKTMEHLLKQFPALSPSSDADCLILQGPDLQDVRDALEAIAHELKGNSND